MLVFEERRKPEYAEKNLSEQRREPQPQTQPTDGVYARIGGRQVLSSLHHPMLSLSYSMFSFIMSPKNLCIL